MCIHTSNPSITHIYVERERGGEGGDRLEGTAMEGEEGHIEKGRTHTHRLRKSESIAETKTPVREGERERVRECERE